MVKEVTNKKQLHEFIYFIKELYKDDPYYVFPIFYAQKKELNEIVLKEKTYKALLTYQNDKVVGRLLYTYDYSKKQGKDICYYSYFDIINDYSVLEELFQYMENDMKEHNIDYSEGTFSPFDPDTRRGVMIKGFDSDPSIFTSYNYPYYGELLERYGYTKAIDTVLLDAYVDDSSKKKLNTFSKFFLRSHDVDIDSLNFKDLDKDLKDIEQILQVATNEIIYQDAPTMDMIENAARQMKAFINPKLVKIAREKNGKPIGFCLVMPDFNQVFKKTKGRIRPLKMLYLKRKITKARGQMQYIVPEYQNTGLIGHMFKVIFDDLVEEGITAFEAGTMMENNPKPINAFKKFGGEITKIYRLYGKEL
jgi:RimJ/RimL family protein N-acetyltransferase